MSQSFKGADILNHIDKWIIPTLTNNWQIFYNQIDEWNDNVKPFLVNTSFLAEAIQTQLSNVNTSYLGIAEKLRLKFQLDALDFLESSFGEVELEAEDEVDLSEGLAEVADIITTLKNGTVESLLNAEKLVSEFQTKITNRFKGYPWIVELFKIVVSIYIVF